MHTLPTWRDEVLRWSRLRGLRRRPAWRRASWDCTAEVRVAAAATLARVERDPEFAAACASAYALGGISGLRQLCAGTIKPGPTPHNQRGPGSCKREEKRELKLSSPGGEERAPGSETRGLVLDLPERGERGGAQVSVVTDEERALLERCGYDEADVSKEFGTCQAFLVHPPYGNRFIDPREEVAFICRVGEEAAQALATATLLLGINYARGVRQVWDRCPERAGSFAGLTDNREVDDALAACPRPITNTRMAAW